MAEKSSIEGLVSSLLSSTPEKKDKQSSPAKKAPKAEDRRRHPRYLVKWRAAIEAAVNGKPTLYYGVTKDISMGGASVFLENNIFFEEAITLHLEVPNGKGHNANYREIAIKARMIHTVHDGTAHRFRAGVEFKAFVNAEDRNFMETLLNAHPFPLA